MVRVVVDLGADQEVLGVLVMTMDRLIGNHKFMTTPELTFKQIHTEHAAGVRRLLHRMGVGNDLDDLAQETFVKIFHHLNEFEARSSLKTWIYSVAINTARDHHRKNKRRSWLSFFGDDTHEVSSHERPDHQVSDREQIEGLLKALSPKLRETVVLHSIQELELQEIAEILKIPLGTVKSRLHEARSKLKEFQAKEAANG
ncbi:MAG: RNA polymerase sigma factor [Pseudobdellovibrionaceae bacterium]|nr:RNA polymerase sigma factor [Pseudobdellovibrionaceae bacterium]